MYCNDSETYEKQDIPKTVNAQIAVLSPKDEQDFLVRKIKLTNGGSMPNHTNEIQHQQYVLSGEAKVVVGSKTYHAKAGDFIYIPAGVEHKYEACYDSDYEFLCMITTKEDQIKLVG
jgi:quercetin dioxygenase-like cupin family protein